MFIDKELLKKAKRHGFEIFATEKVVGNYKLNYDYLFSHSHGIQQVSVHNLTDYVPKNESYKIELEFSIEGKVADKTVKATFFNEKELEKILEKWITEDDVSKRHTVFRYYSIYRPISIGTIPSEPKAEKIVNFNFRRKVNNFNAWGYVEYDKPLTDSVMKEYELKLNK